MRQIKRITGIEGVTAGSPARVKLTTGRRYHALTFFVTLAGVAAAVETVVDRVRLYVGGLPIWDVPVPMLLTMNKRAAWTAPAVGELQINFSDPSRADKVDESVTAWDLNGESSFEVEFVLLSPVGVIGITGLQEFDLGQSLVGGKPLKQVRKVTVIGKNANAGLNDMDNIPKRDAIQRLTFFGATLPDEFWVDADAARVLEAKATELNDIYHKHGAIDVAGSQPLRFDYTERLDDFLVVNKDLNVRFNMPAAGAVQVMVETLAPGFI